VSIFLSRVAIWGYIQIDGVKEKSMKPFEKN